MLTSADIAHAEELQLAQDFTVPAAAAATTTWGILGKKGRGKTHCAVVLAEGLITAGCPVCVLDPTGVWWGLRSSADGRQPGLPVVIFGGEHADVDLADTGGAVLAEVLVEKRFPAVLDLSLMSKTSRRRFATEFLETLYLRNREPLALLIDESDEFAPQRSFAGVERLLGATEDAVRRGRVRGLGITLISQRPAALNKTVLSQVDALIVLGMTAPQDVAAIDAWVSQHADDEQARTVKETLPALPRGEAWVWSPEWLDVLRQVHIRERTTFDSSATPKAGQTRLQPQQWAHVDVEALAERLADAGQQATGADPRRLHIRIRDLERRLAEATTPPPPQRVEVPVITSEQMSELTELVHRLEAASATIGEAAHSLATALDRARSAATTDVPVATPPDSTRPTPPGTTTSTSSRAEPGVSVSAGNGGLGRAERQILAVLAQHGRLTPTQLALLTRRSRKSGGFRNALSKLRSGGLIDGRGEVTLTAAGRSALGNDWTPLPTGPALLDWWKRELGKAERLILSELVRSWPDEVSTGVLAERTGYSSTSGGFRNALSKLRGLRLAEGRGALRAADTIATATRETPSSDTPLQTAKP